MWTHTHPVDEDGGPSVQMPTLSRCLQSDVDDVHEALWVCEQLPGTFQAPDKRDSLNS